MVKKIKSYNLSKSVIAAISEKAGSDDRADSDWLNRYLTKQLLKDDKKPTTKLAVLDVKHPDNLDVAAWNKWIEFRKAAKLKAYKTDAAMKKLAKSEFNDQMPMVQQSIDNEYQGLFALKGVNNGHQSTSKKESSHERIKRENDIKYRGSNECGLDLGAADGHMGRAMGEGERRETIEHVDQQSFVDY